MTVVDVAAKEETRVLFIMKIVRIKDERRTENRKFMAIRQNLH